MPTKRNMIALLALFCTSSIANAQIISKTPNKGDWAKYDVTGKVDTSEPGGGSDQTQGEITIRFLDTDIDENMQTLRWIELEAKISDLGSPEDSRVAIIKILVPDSDIISGKSMADKIKKCYIKEGDDGEEEVKDFGPYSIAAKQFAAMLWPDKAHSKKELTETKITVGAETLECKGISFVVPQPIFSSERVKSDDGDDFEEKVTETDETFDLDVTVYSHDKSPFGLVQFKIRMEDEVKEDMKISMEFEGTLKETGTGAESALPDHK
jgi:hypothetical protein